MKKKEDKTGKKKEKRSPAGLEISKEGICKAESLILASREL